MSQWIVGLLFVVVVSVCVLIYRVLDARDANGIG